MSHTWVAAHPHGVLTEMIEWLTLNVMRTLGAFNQRGARAHRSDDTHLYSTPSLMLMGFFLTFVSCEGSWRSRMSFLPGGNVGESSSRVNTVTYRRPG